MSKTDPALGGAAAQQLQHWQTAAMQSRLYSGFEELPALYMHLLEEVGQRDFFLTLGWFRNYSKTVVRAEYPLRIYGVSEGEQLPGAMLIACGPRPSSGWTSPRSLSSLTNYYSCSFGLYLAPNSERARHSLAALATGIAAEKPAWDTVRIQPLAVDQDLPVAVEAFQSAGFVVQSFFCFGNWYLPVNGRSFAEYVEGLPSALKHTLQRKRRKLERSGRVRIEIITGGTCLENTLDAYTKVYLSSWKKPEPYPEFIPGLARMCAQAQALRLGVAYVDGEPAASQFWVVHNRAALIYKLAYDERFADLSVGTVLTAALMEHVLDVDKVGVVDYLSGDDPYKKDWMSHRRERWGMLAMNPRTARGALSIARNVGERVIKRSVQMVPTGLWPRRKN